MKWTVNYDGMYTRPIPSRDGEHDSFLDAKKEALKYLKTRYEEFREAHSIVRSMTKADCLERWDTDGF